MDLVGGFEQSDPLREVNSALRDLREILQASILSVVPQEAPAEALHLLYLIEGTAENPEATVLLPPAERLLKLVSPTSEVGAVLARVVETLSKPMTVTNPRFEWLDGVIIRALQSGQWLVLDNANLCSASVLDRLNSLLEPEGFISVNEHCDPNGEPRIVRPHPEFRIFLTTDPRYGELSRAMRNRAIEIHLYEPMPDAASHLRWTTAVESTLGRYHVLMSTFKGQGSEETSFAALPFEGVSKADIHLLPRFAKEFQSGLLGSSSTVSKQSAELIEFLRSSSTTHLKAAINEMYSLLPAMGSGSIRDLQVSISEFLSC
jgi:midasin